MDHKKVLILEASSQIGGRATSFRGEGITDADQFRKTLALSAHSWVSDRSEPDLATMIKRKCWMDMSLKPWPWCLVYQPGRVSQALALFNKASIFYPNEGLSGMTMIGSLTFWAEDRNTIG